MKPRLLKPLLLVALAALPLLSPQSSARAQSLSVAQTPAQTSQQTTSAVEDNWERYTYAGEEFSVELPSMPFVVESSRSVSQFKSEPIRTFGLYSRGIVLIVTSFDKPQEQETFDRFATYHWGGRGPAYVRDIKLGDFVGKEYKSVEGVHARAHVFRTKRHAYLVWGMSKVEDDPRIARFLNSFALGGKPSGIAIYEPPPPAVVVPSGPPPATPPVTPQGAGQVSPTTTHAAGEPYRAVELVRKAIIVYKPEPGFTEEARKHNVTGVVRLRAVLEAGGRVGHISVVKGLPDGLTEKAINAARHILFFPAEVDDGRAVSQYVTLEYNFNIY